MFNTLGYINKHDLSYISQVHSLDQSQKDTDQIHFLLVGFLRNVEYVYNTDCLGQVFQNSLSHVLQWGMKDSF